LASHFFFVRVLTNKAKSIWDFIGY
jgi:hypothetical protein